MKRYLPLFLLIIVLVGCNSTKVDQTVSLNEAEKVDWNRSIVETKSLPSTVTDVSKKAGKEGKMFTDAAKIAVIMDFLASDDLQGRDTGSDGIAKAAQFIGKSFESNGVAPYFATYMDTLSNVEVPAYNVVGYLEGQDPQLKDEFVIIGAHYDHIGILEQGENGDTIANGANDNASGTTTVLELARYFGTRKNNKRSILFTLFSAEEKGLLGSKHLAERLKQQGLDLYVMLNFEMVGVPMEGKEYLLYLTGYELSNLAEVSNNYANMEFAGFLPKAKEYNLFKRSDNYPFHNVFNVPSHTYCTFDFTNYEYYHKVGDETDEIDTAHMAKVVNAAIPAMEGIINAPTKEIRNN